MSQMKASIGAEEEEETQFSSQVSAKCITFRKHVSLITFCKKLKNKDLWWPTFSLLIHFRYEKCPTGPLWLCNRTGLRYSAVRWSPSNVRSKDEKTLSGSMNGEQQAQKHLPHTVNTTSAVLHFPTTGNIGVRVEETCSSLQLGVMLLH